MTGRQAFMRNIHACLWQANSEIKAFRSEIHIEIRLGVMYVIKRNISNVLYKLPVL